jgi:SGNH hydrolase-like domain, acetyltransferase AlgX
MLFSQMCGLAETATVQGLSSSPPNFVGCQKAIDSGFYVSQTGWVFSRQELRGDFPEIEKVAPHIINLVSVLAAHGITLVPILLPSRPMIYPPTISEEYKWLHEAKTVLFSTTEARNSYLKFYKILTDAGISSPNILAAFLHNHSQTTFFYGDHHITASGANIIASETYKVLRTLPVYKVIAHQQYNVTTGITRVNPDPSRAHFLQLYCGLQPQELFAEVYSVQNNSQGLSDDSSPEVAYVGTSMGRSWWGLNASFKKALSADVVDYHIEAGGVYTSILDYLSSSSFSTSPAKILLWEIPFEEILFQRPGAPAFSEIQYFNQMVDITKKCTHVIGSADISQLKTTYYFPDTYNARKNGFLELITDDSLHNVKFYINNQESPITINLPDRMTYRHRMNLSISPYIDVKSVKIVLDPLPKSPVKLNVCSE